MNNVCVYLQRERNGNIINPKKVIYNLGPNSHNYCGETVACKCEILIF